MNRSFLKALELGELLYEEAVKPIMSKHFPDLIYSAAQIGEGAEVLEFDVSQLVVDDVWSPGMVLFLSEADHEAYRDKIDRVFRQELPREIHDYLTDSSIVYGDSAGETTFGEGSKGFTVMILTFRGLFREVLKLDLHEDLCVVDWLTLPGHYLRSLTSCRVFHDGLGQLEFIQAKLRYYPHAVWLYLLAAQWRRMAQEEALAGHYGQIGDDISLHLDATRLVEDLMRLCFLMERQYAPHLMWLGTAFARLDCAGQLLPVLTHILAASTWQEQEEHLRTAYTLVARMHNDLGITAPLPTQIPQSQKRGFCIQADAFATAIRAAITSEEVRALPETLGSIDQYVDSTDALRYFDHFKVMYEDR